VGTVAGRRHRVGGTPQRRFVDERAQQLIVAGRGVVHTGDDRIDDMQLSTRGDPLRRDAGTGTNPSDSGRGMFECADHGGTDRHDSAALGDGAVDG